MMLVAGRKKPSATIIMRIAVSKSTAADVGDDPFGGVLADAEVAHRHRNGVRASPRPSPTPYQEQIGDFQTDAQPTGAVQACKRRIHGLASEMWF
jgi:hypothetical protein